MMTNQNKHVEKSTNSAKEKHKQEPVNPEEDFHIESGEKKNALKGNKKRLMGMDSPDDAEEFGNDR